MVNCARGEVNGADLARALREGKLAAASLDVYANEPLSSADELRHALNLLLSPHAAWCSQHAMVRLRELVAQEAVRASRGVELRCPVII